MTSGASATNSATYLRMRSGSPDPADIDPNDPEATARCVLRSNPIPAASAERQRYGPLLPDRPRACLMTGNGNGSSLSFVMVEGLNAWLLLPVKLSHAGRTGAQSHDLRVLAEGCGARARPRAGGHRQAKPRVSRPCSV